MVEACYLYMLKWKEQLQARFLGRSLSAGLTLDEKLRFSPRLILKKLKLIWNPSKVSPNSNTSSISFCLLSLSQPLPKCLVAFWHIANNLRLSWIAHLVCLYISQRINLNLKYLFPSIFYSRQLLRTPIPKRELFWFFLFLGLRSGVAWNFWGELTVTLYHHQILIIHPFYRALFVHFLLIS